MFAYVLVHDDFPFRLYHWLPGTAFLFHFLLLVPVFFLFWGLLLPVCFGPSFPVPRLVARGRRGTGSGDRDGRGLFLYGGFFVILGSDSRVVPFLYVGGVCLFLLVVWEVFLYLVLFRGEGHFFYVADFFFSGMAWVRTVSQYVEIR